MDPVGWRACPCCQHAALGGIAADQETAADFAGIDSLRPFTYLMDDRQRKLMAG
jgi:hypothetical protein